MRVRACTRVRLLRRINLARWIEGRFHARDLLVQGKANKAIAEALVISERTVETHVSSVLTKMEAGSRAELIAKLKT